MQFQAAPRPHCAVRYVSACQVGPRQPARQPCAAVRMVAYPPVGRRSIRSLSLCTRRLAAAPEAPTEARAAPEDGHYFRSMGTRVCRVYLKPSAFAHRRKRLAFNAVPLPPWATEYVSVAGRQRVADPTDLRSVPTPCPTRAPTCDSRDHLLMTAGFPHKQRDYSGERLVWNDGMEPLLLLRSW